MKRFWQILKAVWKIIHRFISIFIGFPLVVVTFLTFSLLSIICDKVTLKAYAEIIEDV